MSNLISAPFYKEGDRIIVGMVIILVPLFSFALLKVWENFKPKVGTIIVVILSILATTLSIPGFWLIQNRWTEVAKLPKTENGQFFNQPRQDFIYKSSAHIPPNSTVLSDPWSGGVYIKPLINSNVVFDSLNNHFEKLEDQYQLIADLQGTDIVGFNEHACAINQSFYIIDLPQYTNSFDTLNESAVYNPLHLGELFKWGAQSPYMSLVIEDNGYALYKIECALD
ncbi:hypothetical protein FACS1894125_3100 [Actinomycetota bacterium]|nr:hypothetical protein FACS1894125_3100 [Actinomycetota bacterium]